MTFSEWTFDSTALSAWLQSMGFHHGNPFATNEADRERSLLPDFFVDVESYDLIRGDQTAIVFAPRGGGKSSLRVMLASYGAPWLPTSAVLAVECTDFDPLIARWQNQQPLTIQNYVDWLLPLGSKALFDTFFYEGITLPAGSRNRIDQARLFRITQLTPPLRVHLAKILHIYLPDIFTVQTIGDLLLFYAPELSLSDWKGLERAVTQYHLQEFISKLGFSDNLFLNLLAELNDFGSMETPQLVNSPKAKLANFVALAQKMRFTAVHFLLDRLDETVETADNPQAQADILEPLLAHLPILEMPGIAFKCFLSQEARNVLWERPTVRQEDRLAEYAVTLKWDESRLKRLLNERLSSYSAHPVTGTPEVPDLATICMDDTSSPEPVGWKIEQAMLAKAQNSPRRLIIAGRLLFEAHLQHHGATGQLNWQDWLLAEKALLNKFPSPLQIKLAERTLQVGQQTIKLTSQEVKIIETLMAYDGNCSRDELATAVWESDDSSTEQAMDAAVNRLRKKIGDDANTSVYLKTIRGQGFHLLNYEIL